MQAREASLAEESQEEAGAESLEPPAMPSAEPHQPPPPSLDPQSFKTRHDPPGGAASPLVTPGDGGVARAASPYMDLLVHHHPGYSTPKWHRTFKGD
jgi:hypothetical protein